MTMRYPIPSNTNPVGTRCFQVNVPDDPDWIAMFWGVLYELTYWNKFERDIAKTGRDIARRWYDVFLDARASECSMPVQFQQLDECTLQASFDGGLTWTTIFNSYNCAIGAIGDSIADGIISPPTTQPPAGGTIPSETCHTYHVTLHANDRWHCPVPVSNGYSITVSNVQGGWADNPGHVWRCPNGEYYVLGACVSPTIPYEPSDPAPSILHMRLIANFNDTTYVDAFNTSFGITPGVYDTQLFIQANDSDLTDNQGSVSFDVEICNYGWCYHVDLTGDLPSWMSIDYGTKTGAGIVSQGGLVPRTDTSGNAYGTRGQFTVTMPADSTIDTITYYTNWQQTPSADTLHYNTNYVGTININGVPAGTGEKEFINTPNHAYQTNDTWWFAVGAGWSGSPFDAGTITITGITIQGSGSNPFGANNC